MHTQLLIRFALLIASCAISAQPVSQTVADVRVGLMRAVQYSTANNRDGVDVFVEAGADLFSVPDASRGDFRVGFGTGNDLDNGVLIVSPRNHARTNIGSGNTGGGGGSLNTGANGIAIAGENSGSGSVTITPLF